MTSTRKLTKKVLFGHTALINRSTSLFSETVILSVSWCHLELGHGFTSIFAVNIDQIVIRGVGVDQLSRAIYRQSVLLQIHTYLLGKSD